MKPVINSRELIAACGLYCGACRRFRLDKCPGCKRIGKTATSPQAIRRLERCKIRQCCTGKRHRTCADCSIDDVRDCKTFNHWIARLFGFIFNTDRIINIRYIRKHGERSYADRMTWSERMAFRRQ